MLPSTRPAFLSDEKLVVTVKAFLSMSVMVQEAPFDPVDPALQVQLVKAALPAGELELDGQTVHDASVVCAVAVPYLPAQHRHGSVHRHQSPRPEVLHSCPLMQVVVLVCSISHETLTMWFTDSSSPVRGHRLVCCRSIHQSCR